MQTTYIQLSGDFEQLIATYIEGAEYRAFVIAHARLQIFQHRIVNHEGDFPGVVVSPEAYAVTGSIIATAGVGKLERHDQLFSFVAE